MFETILFDETRVACPDLMHQFGAAAGDYTGGNFQAKVKVNDRKVGWWR